MLWATRSGNGTSAQICGLHRAQWGAMELLDRHAAGRVRPRPAGSRKGVQEDVGRPAGRWLGCAEARVDYRGRVQGTNIRHSVLLLSGQSAPAWLTLRVWLGKDGE